MFAFIETPSLAGFTYRDQCYTYTVMSRIGTFEWNQQLNYFSILSGHWGGIWEAPSKYSINSNNPNQKDVKLKTKFNNWEYSSSGIQERMPYLMDQRLTTNTNKYGSITGKLNYDSWECCWCWMDASLVLMDNKKCATLCNQGKLFLTTDYLILKHGDALKCLLTGG